MWRYTEIFNLLLKYDFNAMCGGEEASRLQQLVYQLESDIWKLFSFFYQTQVE